ncbi:UDP-N-acetylglucosamine 2-epimerase (hydrolyzing) [Bacillus sp. H-16]|uniref:UDP-N-acetylglucosamine 2-epimerase n=1 Tax=Alteribacter salitolerans TaxID=2912333 RepID=UPI001963156C|nr:UDP-N-acetylglucosamine 2-epimerase [Alteribacter salitolerans]MBM7094963.1 UDP-N-acetylglucosamine 2-epimerase (hydrolyzing) [Alteribacter salitolerans]
MTSKKILCVTGTRADYGIFRPLLFSLKQEKAINLQLVVTGMHLLEEYGYTIEAIYRDNFQVAATPSILFKGDSTLSMSQAAGMGILYFADVFDREKPDGVLLLGDRGEMLAAAVACHYQNIPTFHLHGGEVSGSADDRVRHAISKLSMYHFVSTHDSKKRLIAMGEDAENIIVSGSLRKHDIQSLAGKEPMLKAQLKDKLNYDQLNDLIILAMHPDTKEVSVNYKDQVNAVLAALLSLGSIKVVVIGTNSDAGGNVFREQVRTYLTTNPNARYIESMTSDEYLYLLSQARVLLGNTSSGIIEAPFLKLPFINIGDRQRNRESGDNVIHLDYNIKRIESTIRTIKDSKREFTVNPYDIVDSPAELITAKIKQWITLMN